MTMDRAKNDFTVRVKEAALRFGAHLVGVTGVDRLEGAPAGFRATDLLPEARSVVVMAVSLPQGLSDSWRASVWSYLYYGYAIPNKKLGYAAFSLAGWLQHSGLLSFPVVPTTFMKNCDVDDPRGEFSHKHAAFAAGLGEFGLSNLFLTPQFGSHNRFVSVLTSAELEPDPLYAGPPLCDRCLKCVHICPVGALRPEELKRCVIAGKTIEYADIDKMACSASLVGLFQEAGGCLDVSAKKKARKWNRWDFAWAKARYFLKDPVRATVQAEYQHVIDWGDFCGLCLHACDRPVEKTPFDPELLLRNA
jgi:epoxyqueuosine reductase QueG